MDGWKDRFWTGGEGDERSVRSIRLLVHPYLETVIDLGGNIIRQPSIASIGGKHRGEEAWMASIRGKKR